MRKSSEMKESDSVAILLSEKSKMTIRKKMVQLFLKNVGMNYLGPAIHEYFSVINTAE